MSPSERVASSGARAEAGSVLMLFPAAVLVVLMLGVICVDAGSAFLARRSLIDLVTSSADVAASKAIDQRAFYASPPALRIDPDRAQQIVTDLAGVQRRDGGVELLEDLVTVSPDGRHVTVAAIGRVRPVFAFGSARRRMIVRASATATVSEVRVRPA